MEENQYDLKNLSNEYAKSRTGETKLFQQFLVNYISKTPRIAFEWLVKNEPSEETVKVAEDFNERFFTESLNKAMTRLEPENIKSPTRQEYVMYAFFKDYFETEDLPYAFGNAKRIIDEDPELKTDVTFQQEIQKIAKELEPETKELADYNSQEDEAVFFKIRTGLTKNVERKLTHYDVKKIMEKSLAQFYLTNKEIGKSELDIAHEVDCIYNRKQLPLALQLAHVDTRYRSEKTMDELGNLEANYKHVKKLTSENVKFDFTDDDLQNVPGRTTPDRQRTGTEKVEIVRNLIIDLQSRPVDDSFRDATTKAVACGDKKLIEVLEKNLATLQLDKSIDKQASMLMDSYKLYIKVDEGMHQQDVLAETHNLTKGRKTESVKLATYELDKKGEAQFTAAEYNRFFQRAIRKAEKQEMKRSHKNNFAEEVEAIAKKTSTRIDMEKAKVEHVTSRSTGNSNRMGTELS